MTAKLRNYSDFLHNNTQKFSLTIMLSEHVYIQKKVRHSLDVLHLLKYVSVMLVSFSPV